MITCFVLLAILYQSDESEYGVQERFRVDFVRLDLLVLDRDGNPVTDLRPDELVIKENGKTIQLELFESVDYREFFANTPAGELPTEEPGVTVPEGPVPQFIFALDLESIPLVEMRKTFSQLRETLSDGSFPEAANYLLYSMESGVISDGFIKGYKALVADLNLFEDRMIERYEKEINSRSNATGQSFRGSGRAATGPRDLEGLESHVESCLIALRRPSPPPETVRDAMVCVSDALSAYQEQETNAVRRVIGEIEALTYRFQENEGLKTLFLISPGFSLYPGREGKGLAEFLVSGYFPLGSSVGLNSMEDEFRRVTHACIRNRVVFHTMDIYGVVDEVRSVHARYFHGKNPETKVFYRDYLSSYTTGLTTLAKESGGFHLRAPSLVNSISKVIPRLRFSYLLAYPSPDGKPGKFRNIKIKCKRKGVELHYRQGYFGPS